MTVGKQFEDCSTETTTYLPGGTVVPLQRMNQKRFNLLGLSASAIVRSLLIATNSFET
jgi:hypothetical protein